MKRESFKHLKQTGAMREYVKDFNSLMLDIQNMSNDNNCSILCMACKVGLRLNYGGRESRISLLLW